MRRIIASSVVALVGVFTLAGCITIQLPGGNSNGQPNTTTITCDAKETITEPGSYQLDGRCPSVMVKANDVTIDSGDVVSLEITGDRVTVRALTTTTVVIAGNSNAVNIDTLSDAEVTGDRNSVTSVGTLDRIVVNGNDNKFVAGGIDAVFDNGERTQIG